jgi:hypothetical protein
MSTLPFTQRLDVPAPQSAMMSDTPCTAIPVMLSRRIPSFASRSRLPLLPRSVPLPSSIVSFPASPPSIPMLWGYRLIPLPCSEQKPFFSGLPVPSHEAPFVRMQPDTTPCASFPLPRYSAAFVPTCGMQYIRFPVAGAKP